MQTITNVINMENKVIDLRNLPEIAQQELIAFYEFLVFEYRKYDIITQQEKRAILNDIFQEAAGMLPTNYHFDREELHER